MLHAPRIISLLPSATEIICALGLSDLFGEPSGPSGLWQGLVVGLTCAAAMLTVRLARSARKRIRRAA